MEEGPENGKGSSHSAHGDGMNELSIITLYVMQYHWKLLFKTGIVFPLKMAHLYRNMSEI